MQRQKETELKWPSNTGHLRKSLSHSTKAVAAPKRFNTWSYPCQTPSEIGIAL